MTAALRLVIAAARLVLTDKNPTHGAKPMYAIVTAILIATTPGLAPENKAAYFTNEGPELCYAAADKLNDRDDSTLYVCKVAE